MMGEGKRGMMGNDGRREEGNNERGGGNDGEGGGDNGEGKMMRKGKMMMEMIEKGEGMIEKDGEGEGKNKEEEKEKEKEEEKRRK